MPLHSHHIHRRSSLTSNRSATDEIKSDAAGGADDETTVVEPDQGNVLSHLISQLRPGADLSRVTFPTFILETRSMLERITNFMAHPDTMLPMPQVEDPVERFVSVVKFYLSGWHIKPPGVKKPLNPILGETFTCYWDYPDHTRGYYIAEQTSHHPPKSSYFFMAPDHGIRVDGTLKPRSKFLGNSAASMMEGISYLRFMGKGNSRGGEKYILTQPNMYARGILFGKMKYELGDHSYVRCPENNLAADIEFKTKGYFSGSYNAIGGVIKNETSGETLYELSGLWSGEMYIKDVVTGHKELLFDATNARHAPPQTRPLEEQGERESQRLWHSTVVAVNARDHEKATDEKTKIEERQREEAAKRAEEGLDWTPKLFRRVKTGPGEAEEGEDDLDWILNATIDAKDPAAMTEQILAIAPIIPGQRVGSDQTTVPSQTPSKNATVTRSHDEQHDRQRNNQEPSSRTSGTKNDLIDFGSPPSSATAAADSGKDNHFPSPQHQQQQHGYQHQQQQHRTRAVSLMDDDRHIYAMNKRMENMNLMEPTKTQATAAAAAASSSSSSAGTEPPLKRSDTQTSEVDSFFDAQG